MKANEVKPHELPLYLVQQKKQWNPAEFYRIAYQVDNWRAFMLEEDGLPVGALVLTDEPIADAVVLQTIIIDTPLRCEERVVEGSRLIRTLGVEWARQLGRKYIIASTMPAFAERWLAGAGCGPSAHIIEATIREEV